MSVNVNRLGPVAEVRINRPDKMNAVDGSVFEGLAEAGDELRTDRTVRAVVLTGEGDNFSAGVDLSFMRDAMTPERFGEIALNLPEGQTANYFQRPSTVWQDVEVPVICALKGVAFGAGCQIALGADIRIAALDIRMSVMEMKWGLIPDMGLMTTLPQLMRQDQAKELVLTGRVVEAEEALSLGLVTRLSETPLEDAHAFAEQIASQSPDAVRAAKALLNQGWQATPAQSLKLEAELQAGVLGKPNQIEAVMANLQKRPPAFTDD